MGTNLTFSATSRARHCAWPYRDDVSYPERPQRRDADEGTEVHTMLEHWLAGEPVPTMVATVVPRISSSGRLRPPSRKDSALSR